MKEMKDLLKQVPGFRSDTIWKRVVSCLFYFAFIFSIISGGLEGSLVFGGIILLGVSIIDLVKNKKSNVSFKTPMLLLLAGIILLSSGSQVASKAAIASQETKALKLTSEKNEELKTEINTLKEDKQKLKSANLELKEGNEKLEYTNLELKEENEKFLAEESKKKEEAEELARKEEEEVQKQKEALAAKSQESAKSTNNSNNSYNQGVAKSAPAQASAENTVQVLVTRTGKKYHKRKCGNGNYTPATLSNAKARGLGPCGKCY